MSLRGKQTDGSILSINTPVRPAPGASYDALGESIRSVGNPSATPAIGATSAATPRSIAWKQPVRLATEGVALPGYTWAAGVAGDGELTAIANGALSIDGVPVAINDRVLVKDETGGNAPYNGLYIVGNPGSAFFQFVLVRAPDAASNSGLIPGIACNVVEGTANHSTQWMLGTAAPIVLNVTPLLFTVSGGVIAVNTIADLGLLDASNPDGTQVFVKSVRSLWTLRTGVVAPDGITIVAALDPAKTWFRVAAPRLWNGQATFYINGTTGNDESSGAAVNAPIKTFGELGRRTYIPGEPRGAFTVEVTGNVVERGSSAVNTSVIFNGTLTELHGAADITAVVQFNMPAVCVRQSLTAAALTFGAQNQLRLSNDNGATFHQIGWAVSPKGTPIANSAYTKIYDNGGGLSTLADTDTIYEYTLPAISENFTIEGDGYVEFNDIVFAGDIVNGTGVSFFRSAIGYTNAVGTGFSANFDNCADLYFDYCKLNETPVNFFGCPKVLFTASNMGLNATVKAYGSQLKFESESGFVGGTLQLFAGSILRINGNQEHSGGAQIQAMEPGTTIDVASAGQTIWGLTGGNFALVKTNTRMTFDPTSVWTAAGNYTHSDGAGGTTLAALTTLPAAQSTLAMPTHAVGVFRRS